MSRGGSCAEAGPDAGSSTTRRNAASTRRALTRRALTRRASNRRASPRRASQRGGNRKLRRRCMLVLNCEVRARRMGLQPRLARAASSCACSEAASSPWSGSRGRDQPWFRQRTAKIVKAGVAGPAASDRGGEAEMRAPTRMRPPPTTTPAKIKPRRSRQAHAADEPATAEAVPFKQPLVGSRNPPEVPPIKEGIQSCKQSRREESNERSKKKKPQGGVITMP